MSDPLEAIILRREIIDLLDKWHPVTVGDLVSMLREKRGLEAAEITVAGVLDDLKREGRLTLERPPRKQTAFSAFLKDSNTAGDFWAIVASILILDTIISQPGLTPLNPIRFILGIPAILLLPGYSIQMGLFPKSEDMLLWKRIILAVGLSIAATGFYAIILDATTQGIVLGSIIILFSAHSLFFAWIGLLRRFEAQRD
jgi:uncharacterized protein DUF1616